MFATKNNPESPADRTDRTEESAIWKAFAALKAAAHARLPLLSPEVQNALKFLQNAGQTSKDLIKEHLVALCCCSVGCCYFGCTWYSCTVCICSTCAYLAWYTKNLDVVDIDTDNFGMVSGRINSKKMS